MTRLLALALLAAGCSPSLEEVVKKRRPEVEKTFAAIKALQPTLAGVGPSAELKLEPPAVPLDLATNATFLYAEEVRAPGEAFPVNIRTLDSEPLLHCGALLSKGTFYEPTRTRVSPSLADAALARCGGLRFLLVLRVDKYEPAVIIEEGRTYQPGEYTVDVLPFDLTTGKSLGGFTVTATNDVPLQAQEGEPLAARLAANLASRFFDALRAETGKRFPGAVPKQK